MTTVPNPADLMTGLTCAYDAWSRMVQVLNGSSVIANFRYDGQNRRIVEQFPGGTPLVRHAYYNGGWQLLETREGSSTSTPPATLPVKYHYVWSQRYVELASPSRRAKRHGHSAVLLPDRRQYERDGYAGYQRQPT